MNQKQLNASQKRAVAHLSGPMLALAGPGSGKTSTIANRITYLIQEYRVLPETILVVTFSRAAAREMKERFLQMNQIQETKVTFGTFHGIFYGILRHAYGLSGKNILGENQKYQILRMLTETHAPALLEEGEALEELSREIGQVKSARMDIANYYSSSYPDETFRKIYRGYVEECRKRRLLDFEDMLVMCWELLKKRPDILAAWQKKFQYILVDEVQDMNQVQYDIVRMLGAPENNLFFVGDDDQSIYHFRGARPEIMLHFPEDYPGTETVLLNINYRCTEEILQKAGRLIAHNRNRFPKELSTPGKHGEPVRILCLPDPREECRVFRKELLEYLEKGGEPEQVAVLFRTHMEAELLVQQLMEYNIPFQMKDRLPNLYQHWIGKNILSYLRMARGPISRGDFLAVMNRPLRYISREAVYEKEVSFETLRMFYEEKEWMCDRLDEMEHHLKVMSRLRPYAAIVYLRNAVGYEDFLRDYALERKMKPEELTEILDRITESAREAKSLEAWEQQIREYEERLEEEARKQADTAKGVVLATLHSVKGLEYDRVYIFNVNEGSIPYKKAVLPQQLEEERRLLYVGMTRAREHLTLCYVTSQFEKERVRSRFLDEMED
ncbi:MAG TPA: ATP-dependent helicase [Candidatus Blautia gallistercoris]|uniref:DNA 3'-5' helicase n=1 Tax=Candidatus Blautia gallistercoris TaxID=2838490 RepID=A0A9D2B3L8_9FIRM|nr:ATP-dependent helicase [Candidatus Blautia gallistercoris]